MSNMQITQYKISKLIYTIKFLKLLELSETTEPQYPTMDSSY